MTEIRADEISRILREQIKGYGKHVEVSETGTVLSTGDGIARVYGLEGVMAGELVEFPHRLMGLVLNLEEDSVGVALMGEQVHLREGDVVKRTGRIADVPVGAAMAGRVVDALGQPVDGKGPIAGGERHTCALLNDGTPRCWGDDFLGQAGYWPGVPIDNPAGTIWAAK